MSAQIPALSAEGPEKAPSEPTRPFPPQVWCIFTRHSIYYRVLYDVCGSRETAEVVKEALRARGYEVEVQVWPIRGTAE